MPIHCRLASTKLCARYNPGPLIKNPLESKDDQYHGDAYTGRGPEVRVVGLQEVISAAHWRSVSTSVEKKRSPKVERKANAAQ